jgi:putative DNA primase/helicase
MKRDIKAEFVGRWESVLVNIGIEENVFSGKHQPCIFCGGRDRSRWDRMKEFYICNSCGSFQPLDMAMNFLDMGFKETVKILRPKLGDSKLTAIQQPSNAANEARILKIYKNLTRITPDTTAFLYLANRGIGVLPEANLYAHPGIDYWDTSGDKPVKVGNYPAMVGVFKNLAMETATYHITYLNSDGTKADVESIKKILPSIKPLPGSAIKLFESGDCLAVCEGIETAMAVTKMTDVPCWACGNTTLL